MTTDRGLLRVAAMASAAAGLVHGAAAGAHSDDATLAMLFALVAALQLGWAATLVLRPARWLAGAGVLLNAAVLIAWGMSRTVGWPVVASMAEPSSATIQDLTAAGLAAVALAAAFTVWMAAPVPSRLTAAPMSALLAFGLLGLAVPAMATEHDHDHGGRAHAHDETHHASHAHDDAHHDETHHDETHHAANDQPIVSLDDPRLTDLQRDAARALIDDVHAQMARFSDVASVEAEGYESIGDGVTGWEHFTHPVYRMDPISLDPRRPESIVFRVNPDGSKDLVSAMFILPPDRTMDDVPDIAGSLTSWHDHQDLCWIGNRVVGLIRPDGSCANGEFRPTAPMLHVWLEPHPCGPFAGIEGHGDGCGHAH